MGFMEEFKKGLNGDEPGEVCMIAGKSLVCPHCEGNRFYVGEAQLNTAGLTFLGLDWANHSAKVYECCACGHLEWFF
ncbi:MAG: DNA-binding protein [Eggerthellaceae bacterium]|nr:DNA-binding protein [Eggerthellaceae bacterium]